jgi:hypothetical protein
MQKQLHINDLSADASSVSKGANVANIASAGANVGIGVFSVISDISDKKQRALFEANFRSLSAEQQKKIELQVASVNSQDAKLSILANALTQLGIARISTQAGLITEGEKKKRNQMILIGGGMIAIGLIITVIIIKKL